MYLFTTKDISEELRYFEPNKILILLNYQNRETKLIVLILCNL